MRRIEMVKDAQPNENYVAIVHSIHTRIRMPGQNEIVHQKVHWMTRRFVGRPKMRRNPTVLRVYFINWITVDKFVCTFLDFIMRCSGDGDDDDDDASELAGRTMEFLRSHCSAFTHKTVHSMVEIGQYIVYFVKYNIMKML